MDNKEFLSEERYQKAKKKITKISLLILLVGMMVGIGFIATAIITQNNTKKINEKRYNEAYKKSEQRIKEAKERLAQIAREKETINSQIEKKEYECDSMDMNSTSWFEDSSQCRREVSKLNDQLSDLEMEEFQLENKNYKELYIPILPIKYLIFYYIGASIIAFTCVVAGIFYIIAKRREIRAFTIQQTMPVTQEVIGKMAPTIGNAAETIAEKITTGIKNGSKE